MARISADMVTGNLGAPPADEPPAPAPQQPGTEVATKPATKAPAKQAAKKAAPAKRQAPAPADEDTGRRAALTALASFKRKRAKARQQLGLRITNTTAERLRRLSTMLDVPQQDIAETALRHYLDTCLGPEAADDEGEGE